MLEVAPDTQGKTVERGKRKRGRHARVLPDADHLSGTKYGRQAGRWAGGPPAVSRVVEARQDRSDQIGAGNSEEPTPVKTRRGRPADERAGPVGACLSLVVWTGWLGGFDGTALCPQRCVMGGGSQKTVTPG